MKCHSKHGWNRFIFYMYELKGNTRTQIHNMSMYETALHQHVSITLRCGVTKFTHTSYNQSQLPGNTWHIPHIPGYVTSIYPVQFQLDIWHHRHPLTTIIMNTSFHCFCLIVLNNQCPVNNKCAQYRRHVCSDLDLHNNYHSLTNWMVLNSRFTIIWW